MYDVITQCADSAVEYRVGNAFQNGKWENEWRQFADGMRSDFAAELEDIVTIYGDEAIAAISKHVEDLDGSGAGDVIHEALDAVGRMADARTHESRRLMLEKFLGSPNLSTRDSASIGIELLGDAISADAVSEAAENESDDWERKWLRQLGESLKNANRE